MNFIKEKKTTIFHWVLTITFILVIVTCINTMTILSEINSLKRTDSVTSDKDKETFKSITEIYSSCGHDWTRLTEPTERVGHYYITIACKKCGTVQVMDITDVALYVNIE